MRIKYLITALKGFAMGSADVVPGVSGGTIAFITGIYAELLSSIKSFDLTALKLLVRLRFRDFWKKINGNFLFSVVAGIGISIFTLAKGMLFLLDNYPIGLWAFFFGLIIASTLLVSKEITKWSAGVIAGLGLGAVAAFALTTLTPASTPETWWFIMITGAVAICAMILPGISGAFILLLMSKYHFMMEAVSQLRVGIILLFVTGAVIGIISFSHLLTWLLDRYKNITTGVLTGFMIGALNKVWPWKETVEVYTDSHGAIKPLVQENVLPQTYETLYGVSPQLWQAVGLCVAGFVLIAAIDAAARKMSHGKKSDI